MVHKSGIENNSQPLEISESAQTYLKETSGWTHFIAILGFIFVGLLVVGAIVVSLFLSAMNNEEFEPILSLLAGGIYLLVGVLYFFPILFLYRFATNMKKALEKKDNENLDKAFMNIKSHYKFMGIFTIIFIALYILGAIAMLIFGSFF